MSTAFWSVKAKSGAESEFLFVCVFICLFVFLFVLFVFCLFVCLSFVCSLIHGNNDRLFCCYASAQTGVPSFLSQMQAACAGYPDYQLRLASSTLSPSS